VVSALRRQWPIAASLAVVVAGLVVVASGHFRRGTLLLSFGVALALFLRLLLPGSEAGLLAVRSKKVDVAVLATLALGTSLLALWVPSRARRASMSIACT
jgi:hypothetical protein